MGIAKTINAIGKYDFYTFNYEEFTKKISTFFNVDLEIVFFHHIDEFEEYDEFSSLENETLNSGFTDTWKMTINYFKIDENLPVEDNLTCSYELYIPVNIKYEKELILEFCDNGLFILNFLPFENAWCFFIEKILGLSDKHFKTKTQFSDDLNSVRNGYLNILKKINCSEVILTTDANYRFLNYLDPSSKHITLNELIQVMNQEDNINIYNFCDIVNTRQKIDSKRNSYLDIALIDNFDDAIDLSKIELNIM